MELQLADKICMSMSQWTCFEFGGKIGANSLHPETLTASIGNTASLMYQQRETPGTIGLGLCPT